MITIFTKGLKLLYTDIRAARAPLIVVGTKVMNMQSPIGNIIRI